MVTIAPITSTVRGLGTEVPVGPVNGIDHNSVANVDNITTVEASALGRLLGYFHPDREAELSAAIKYAFDLEH
jgi:mRNA interferase MazF